MNFDENRKLELRDDIHSSLQEAQLCVKLFREYVEKSNLSKDESENLEEILIKMIEAHNNLQDAFTALSKIFSSL